MVAIGPISGLSQALSELFNGISDQIEPFRWEVREFRASDLSLVVLDLKQGISIAIPLSAKKSLKNVTVSSDSPINL